MIMTTIAFKSILLLIVIMITLQKYFAFNRDYDYAVVVHIIGLLFVFKILKPVWQQSAFV
ncbi:hypothetical protein T492DRAFT_1022602 [Pavlovales sp. CCMP2436]|nr:hypothetical protein T492DRAFT_1022602 [Pavlovales sp. CCMP2436]